ncbi:putative ornithine cyclodeaminase, mu-crystallin [Mycobacteroides abscessus subsp. abscessus]|nr:putative ornithine cyclodeaminase, mu-crystallin [Mycobacteroides abscessus subsp. abscessus]
MKTFTAEKVFALGYRAAADALTAALERGFDPASDPERTFTPVDAGEFLTMPSSVGKDAGIKILTLAPHNPEKDRPFIQGTYLLCDAETLTPHSLVEGIALTALRTPAVAIAGARPALSAIAAHVTRRPNIVAFGAGVQGEGLVRALAAECGDGGVGFEALGAVTYAVRNPDRVSASALAVGEEGCASEVGAVRAGSDACRAAVEAADVIVCASAATEAVFEDSWVQPHAAVLAVGAHTPQTREVPAATMGRARVIVEDEAVALRENGDVVRAIADGFLADSALVSMKALLGEEATMAAGEVNVPDAPTVVTTVGMSWQDLVVAAAVAKHVDEDANFSKTCEN